LNRSIAAVLPRDWVRWNEIEPGDLLEIEYDGQVQISAVKKSASASEGRNPGGPARRPAQPARTDEENLADAGD
jgi:hypothetical protein